MKHNIWITTKRQTDGQIHIGAANFGYPTKKVTYKSWSQNREPLVKKIRGRKDLNYRQRPQRLQLYSKQRRERYRAIHVWKILERQEQ